MSGIFCFYFGDRILDEKLHPFDLKAMFGLESFKDRGAIAIKEIEVGHIEREALTDLRSEIQCDLLEQDGVRMHHRARDP